MYKQTSNMIKVAKGDVPADLVLRNARIVNVFTGEVVDGDIAIAGGFIAGVGKGYSGVQEVDLGGYVAAPGLIDAHVHIESSMLSPLQFSRAISAHGVTTVVADPHELANVMGLEGINYIISSIRRGSPVDIFIMLPTCVPATRFETSGAELNAATYREIINEPEILGLGEMMNYPGVVATDDEILSMIELAAPRGFMIDGHAPHLTGKDLTAYIAAGIRTDHECETVEELRERVSQGMYVLLREGSAAKNVASLVKGVTDANIHRLMFCTDDRHPEDILHNGSIDNNIRVAAANGLSPVTAITMATLCPAQAYDLKWRGAVAPGYIADIAVFDNLQDLNVVQTYKNGVLTARGGECLRDFYEKPNTPGNSVHLAPISAEDIALPPSYATGQAVSVIGVKPDSILTRHVRVPAGQLQVEDGMVTHPADVLKLVVVERHYASGNVGVGLAAGFGIKGGAIASTVAHDSHNIICVGDNDADILAAIAELERVHGGVTVVRNGKAVHTLALPVAGLMSPQTLESVAADMQRLKEIAREMGAAAGQNPFMALSFLALPVIPELRLTDRGLFDVQRFAFAEL
ncbi:MAG: adenine deaminase [Defluviitaleaceae bacterium]|nr:adenine deaminase [Defluviitaleaceae bacterium]